MKARMLDGEIKGSRIFSSAGRSLAEEDEIEVTSVGVDIGSSTSHLVFSRIVLERMDSRYVVTAREAFYESEILLTPYASGDTIDSDALGGFISRQYAKAGIDPDKIDTGALILTGVAVRRRNARLIGELFAAQAGKMVAVSAGDNLETTMAAYGSGAVAASDRAAVTIMNLDIGGGTAKVAICRGGRVVDLTAIDVGARLVCLDEAGKVVRVEEAGRRIAGDLGIDVELGATVTPAQADQLAARMADLVFEAAKGGTPRARGASLLRLDALTHGGVIDEVSFSGGVSEYIYGRADATFGDLGPRLAREIKARIEDWGPRLVRSNEGIRATVIGASQYTMQVSGSTIFVTPHDALPLRNVPVIAPDMSLDAEHLDAAAIAAAIAGVLRRLDLAEGDAPVALAFQWRGSATFDRLDAFCRGVAQGLAPVLAHGHPITLVSDGDIGGLIGLHCLEELKLENPVVSIDGIELKEFDYIDIGALLVSSGAVPVVIKSLIFPASTAIGKEWQAPE
jgi:ethanolamine utilization protein EutA